MTVFISICMEMYSLNCLELFVCSFCSIFCQRKINMEYILVQIKFVIPKLYCYIVVCNKQNKQVKQRLTIYVCLQATLYLKMVDFSLIYQLVKHIKGIRKSIRYKYFFFLCLYFFPSWFRNYKNSFFFQKYQKLIFILITFDHL